MAHGIEWCTDEAPCCEGDVGGSHVAKKVGDAQLHDAWMEQTCSLGWRPAEGVRVCTRAGTQSPDASPRARLPAEAADADATSSPSEMLVCQDGEERIPDAGGCASLSNVEVACCCEDPTHVIGAEDRNDSRTSWSTAVSLCCMFNDTVCTDAHFAQVEDWYVNVDTSLAAKVILVISATMLTWAISLVLASAGLLAAVIYKQAFVWSDGIDGSLFFALVGGIFTSWNIAQYASYAIQTTGHTTLRQHARALLHVGPPLLSCNALGWMLGASFAATPVMRERVVTRALVTVGPPVLAGIVAKTLGKNAYLLQGSCASMDATSADDALSKRLSSEGRLRGYSPPCPFKSVSSLNVFHAALGPLACALWTSVYVVILRLAHCWAAQQAGALKLALQLSLFALSMSIVVAGDVLLGRWIAKSTGYMGYSTQMVLVFYFIYYSVSDVQVRLGVVQMDGMARWLCTFLQPSVFTFLRYRSARWWKHHGTSPRSMTSAHDYHMKPRLIIACVISMVSQNVSSALVSGVTCIFRHSSAMQLGCCENPIAMQMVIDSFSTWAFDCVGFWMYVRLHLPALYVFSLLDSFLVIAAMVIVYLNVMLALLTGAISL